MSTDQHRPALWFSALTSATDDDHRHRALESGEGCFVRDGAGRRYLDARSALWNAALGYDNPRVRAAMHRQLDTLPVAQLIRHEQPTALALAYARRLVAALPGDLAHVRFCTTGAQAVEGAVMLSRFIRRHQGRPERTEVIALWDGYHGVGGLASGLTGEPPLHRLQAPLANGVRHVRAGDPDELRDAVTALGPERVTAILVEPVLGTGVVELSADYLRAARELCDRHGIHLVFDEVSTGFGRTGSLTAAERLGVVPDMMLLSKGITAGYSPLAAIAVTGAVLASALDADVVFPHGSTSDGHPLALAAADAVLDEFADGSVLRNVVDRGAQLTAALRDLGRRLPTVSAVHGPGLMVAVTLVDSAGEPLDRTTMTAVKQSCLRNGLLVSLCGSMVVLTPPLVITAGDVDLLVDLLERGLREAVEQPSGPAQQLLAHS
ncbi:aminotransferase family protein [Micromonospora psammae]|uniref:aminotransferase family protein n=1 Tax=Micromonospora sp. CPCC 205556 TaxID=3122398 RepID=UPI002FF1043F